MSPTPFTLAGYEALIGGLIERGYALRTFHDVAPGERHLVLRHDVDQSIGVARAMAEAETARSWCSAWFVLVRTEMYNPFSRGNTTHLRAMAAVGHEIGLHLDTTHYGDAAATEAGAAVECRMLEDIVERPVRLVSFHRPAPELLGGDAPIAGRLHTYMRRFTTDIGYVSDSRGAWGHGHPWQHEAVRRGQALQLLTHAIWWVGADGRDARGRLHDLLAAKSGEIEAELAANNAVWGEKAR